MNHMVLATVGIFCNYRQLFRTDICIVTSYFFVIYKRFDIFIYNALTFIHFHFSDMKNILLNILTYFLWGEGFDKGFDKGPRVEIYHNCKYWYVRIKMTIIYGFCVIIS